MNPLLVAKSSGVGRQNGNKKLSVFLIVAIVVLGCLTYVVISRTNHRAGSKTEPTTSPSQITSNCSNDRTPRCLLLREAVPLLDPGKVRDLAKTVEKIKELANYDKDPSMLLVIFTYHVNLSDAQNARATLNQLNKQTASHQKYDPLLDKIPHSPKQLEELVKILEEGQKRAKNNFWGITPQGTRGQP